MSVGLVATIVGFFSGSTGILNYNGALTSPQGTNDGTTAVRIAAGMNGGTYNTVGADGSAQLIYLANDAGQTIAYTNSASTSFGGALTSLQGYIGSGQYGDYHIQPMGGFQQQQATYILLTPNGPDDLCIPYSTTTFVDGTQMGWVGDWAEICIAPWYYSNVFMGGTDYSPRCAWVGGQYPTGISWYWPAYSADPQGNLPAGFTTQQICSDDTKLMFHHEWLPQTMPTGFGESNVPPESAYGSGGPVKRDESRSRKPIKWSPGPNGLKNPSHHNDRLVISKHPRNHNVTHLCTHPSSSGPDFANEAEGKYCRMSDKTLHDICAHSDQDNCFDMDTKQLIINGVSTRSESYREVIDWRPDQPHV